MDSVYDWIRANIGCYRDYSDEQIFKLKEIIFGWAIDNIHEDIGLLTNLEKLTISSASGRCCSSLPTSIGNLINLKTLYIFPNHLESLPDEIGNLRELRYLNINNNLIESLPTTIGNLCNLEVLHVAECRLKSLPSEMAQLENLKYLYAYGNNITSLPREFENFTSLVDVHLSENPLRESDTELMRSWILTNPNLEDMTAESVDFEEDIANHGHMTKAAF